MRVNKTFPFRSMWFVRRGCSAFAISVFNSFQQYDATFLLVVCVMWLQGDANDVDGRGGLKRLSGMFPRSPSIQSIQSMLSGLGKRRKPHTLMLSHPSHYHPSHYHTLTPSLNADTHTITSSHLHTITSSPITQSHPHTFTQCTLTYIQEVTLV